MGHNFMDTLAEGTKLAMPPLPCNVTCTARAARQEKDKLDTT